MKKINNNRFIFLISLVCLILSRIYYISKFPDLINGDEAVLGLMGKYISEGKDFPVFMWLGHYAGTISSYIFALFIKIFDFNPAFLKITILFWEVTGVLFFSFLFNYPLRFLVPLFMIIPYEYTFLFPFYLECFSLAFISFYILKKISEGNYSTILFFCSGFLNGFGLYHQPIFIPFFITFIAVSFKYRIFNEFKKRVWFEAGFIIGLSPLIIYNFIHEFATAGRLGGFLINEIKNKTDWFLLFNNFFDAFSLCFIMLSIFSFIFILYSNKTSFNKNLFISLFIISLLFYFFPGVRKARYLMPFFYGTCGLILIAIETLKDKNSRFFWILSFFLVTMSIYDFSVFLQTRKYYNFQSVIDFLNKKEIKYCYSDYWTAYPITFISGEKIIVSPRMNDRIGFYDRTPHYYQIVKNSSEKCFIIPDNFSWVYSILSMKLSRMRIPFERYRFNNYYIFLFNYNGDDSVFLI